MVPAPMFDLFSPQAIRTAKPCRFTEKSRCLGIIPENEMRSLIAWGLLLVFCYGLPGLLRFYLSGNLKDVRRLRGSTAELLQGQTLYRGRYEGIVDRCDQIIKMLEHALAQPWWSPLSGPVLSKAFWTGLTIMREISRMHPPPESDESTN
jgi:hypothetical protein